jgi:Bacterial conjugation TrbI-like protein
MSGHDAINFVKSPTGRIAAFCVLLMVALIVVAGFKKPASAEAGIDTNTNAKPSTASQVVQTVEHDIAPWKFPKPDLQPVSHSNVVQQRTQEQKPERLPISLYAEPVSAETEDKPLGKIYAPYGRLIPCELVVTIDSARMKTPIIGLITEDIYHAGRLVIPAGTEVHGTAQTDPARERLASGNHWTLVWKNGEELTLSGIALDREQNPDGDGWAITDGSAGLRGRIIKSDNLAEIKLFAAAFLSGAAGELTQRQNTVFGPIATTTIQNGATAGAEDVLGTYAKQILDSIERDGFYVRIPAGKQFYLYVMQTIDQSEAKIGGTRFDASDTNAPMDEPAAFRPRNRQQPTH